MTWGIPTPLFLQLHVILSLVAMVSGIVVLLGMLSGRPLGGWTVLFLATAIVTSITGFPLEPFGFDPPRMVGIISLLLLAFAVAAIYLFQLGGAWRWVHVVAVVAALYLDVFVGVVQAFEKLAFLQPLAPTQSEPPFKIAQLAVLVIFVVLGFLAVKRFHPAIKATA